MPETLGEVDEELVRRLRFSVTRLSRLLRQQDESGLSPTMAATLATIAREGPLTLGELAAHERVAPPTISAAVGKLESAGLLERMTDPDDRRLCRVKLSPVGRKRFDLMRGRRTAWLVARIAEIPGEDLSRLRDTVELLEHLAAAPERKR